MSGVKCSSIELEREQKARQDALRKIEGLAGVSVGLRQQALAMIAALPDGVRQSFVSDLSKAEQMLTERQPVYRKNQSSAELSQVASQIERINEIQRNALQMLTDIRESKRDAKAREIYSRLETMQGEFCGHQSLLDKWHPGTFNKEMSMLRSYSEKIAAGDFINVTSEMNKAQGRIANLIQKVSDLEAKDGERRFVLEALQEVIKEMGWKEVLPPTPIDPRDPASPIRYEVDTYYAGEIQFSLALDGIKSHSDISNDARGCYKEFGNISEKLKTFGIKTAFIKTDNESDLPKLKAQGEIEFPDSGCNLQLTKNITS